MAISKSERKARIIAAAIAIGALGFYFIFYAVYYFSAVESNEEGVRQKCVYQRKEGYGGVVVQIDSFNSDDFMKGKFFSLRIHTGNSPEPYTEYMFLMKGNEMLFNFVHVGDTVAKVAGDSTFNLTHQGKVKTFNCPDCGRY